MKKVIITGASGFIGKALTKYLLDKGVVVFAIVREVQKLDEFSLYSNLNIITCDMNEYFILPEKIKERNFDACFHIAWEGLDSSNYNTFDTQVSNIKKSVDLLDTLSVFNVEKLLFANSLFQYKYFRTDFEDYSIVSNCDIYGIIKKATSKIIKKMCLQNNINYYDLIFPNIYGIGDYSKHLTNVVINCFQTNVEPKLADASILCDWTYIDDVIKAIITVVEKGKPFKYYYIGSRNIKTFGEVISNVRDIINPSLELNFGTYHDIGFIDYDKFFNDDLYLDTGFEINSDFAENIKKTAQWVKTLDF